MLLKGKKKNMKKEKIILSIIIPIYNVEKYISQCLDSILLHNLENCEIILVDDGSTDNSTNICKEYEKNNFFIKLYEKENGGAADARNFGLNVSKGKYIMFIDSDDYLVNNKNFELLKSKLYENYDIIQYKMNYYYENKKELKILNDLNEYSELNYLESLYKKVSNNQFSISPCDKIVKRDLLLNNSIFFKKGLLAEDIDWSLSLYLYAKSILTLNLEIYIYRQNRIGSVTNTRNPKLISSLYSIINKWYYYDYDNDNLKEIFHNYLAYQYLILISIIDNKNCDKKMKENIYSLRKILSNDINNRVKMVNKIMKIFGFKTSIVFLKSYLFLKDKGLIKL